MRSRGETVGVVDFGSRQIRVLIACRDEDGAIQVIGHGTAPGRGCVSRGVIQDSNAAQLALNRALTAAEKEARVRINSLFCGVNGKNVETFVREGCAKLEHQIVEPQHLNEATDIASRDILAPGKSVVTSITAREWYVDDLRVIDPLGIRGQVLKIRVHFARIPDVILENMTSCIESQRRQMEDIIFLPLAASLGCLTPEDMELGAAVLDIGRSITGLAVHRDYRTLGTHTFELAGYDITRDVSAGLQISFDEADELILEYGISNDLIRAETGALSSGGGAATEEERGASVKLETAVRGAPGVVDRKELDLIIHARAKELMTRVRDYLHQRGLSRNLVRGLVLTGGASTIKNCKALAEAVFEVPCRVGLPTSVEILPHAVASPEFSAAVGIVRHAFEYRAAARNGRLDAEGPIAAQVRKAGRFLRRYFL